MTVIRNNKYGWVGESKQKKIHLKIMRFIYKKKKKKKKKIKNNEVFLKKKKKKKKKKS